ncbi:site-specific DNA-methyltransferase [Clostridiaceae bacterium Marseille-Q3526]|nr:site-specific DNA-methyltransferase [Clostridiaceae bacterium Marseille-Q3526]
MDKLKMHTPNKADENFKKLAALFPNAVTETIDENGEVVRAIDKDVLMQEISCTVVEGSEERYQFSWPDKKKSVLLANAPINKTLRPCREESVNFDTTENLYIEGDNLEVLKLLQETYLGKIKMIYIDPPYNTGNDFVYEDDFAQNTDEYLANSGQFDEDGNRLVKNLDSNGRFHTDWLNMIYPRLKLAKDLLSDDGVIFISLDSNEIDNLIKLCNEVFGESNFVDCITWNKRVPKNDNNGIGNIHEYILAYVKNSSYKRQFTMQKDGLDEIYDLLADLKRKKVPIEEAEHQLKQLYKVKGYDRGITLYNSLDDNYEPWGKINMSWPNADTFGPRYDVLHPITKKPTKVPDRGWRWSEATFNENVDFNNIVPRYDGSYVCGNIWFAKDENTQPSSIKYLRDVARMLLRSIISLKSDGGIEVEKIFEGKSFFPYPKPVALMRLLIDSLDEKEGIFLDFFSGSATTAHAVMQLNAEDDGNRRFIMVQLPEETGEKSEAYKAGYKNICEIGKERIRRAGKKIKEDSPLTTQNLDIGFRVLKCDTSNMKDVYYSPTDFDINLLDMMADNIKEDRTPEDLLFQVMLDLGVTLSSKIEETTIAGKKVFDVADGFLVACFDKDVSDETIKAIAQKQPYYFVMRDSSLANDSVATNFEQIFATYSPDTVRKVL